MKNTHPLLIAIAKAIDFLEHAPRSLIFLIGVAAGFVAAMRLMNMEPYLLSGALAALALVGALLCTRSED